MKRAPLLLLLLVVACAGDAPVGHDFNPTADFATYQSFVFEMESVDSERESVAQDPRVMDTVRDTIREDLTSRSMTEDGPGAGFSIAIQLAEGEQTGVDQWGVSFDSGGGGTVGQVFQFKAGTIVIDFFDRATEQLVWRGWAESAVTRTDDLDLDFLAQIVQAVLAQYPPSPEED